MDDVSEDEQGKGTTTVDVQRETNDSVKITVRTDGTRTVFTVPTRPLVEPATSS